MKLAPVFVLVAAWLHAQEAIVVSGSTWKLDDGRKLGAEVKSVAAGASITGSKSSTPLMLVCGSDWVVHTCPAATCKMKACESSPNTTSLKPWEWAKSTPEGLARSLLKREPVMAAVAGARDNLEGADALLQTNGEVIYFAPALRRIPEGAYCLQLSALPKGASAQHRVTLTWKKDPQGAASLPGFSSGLYALDIARLSPGGACQFDSSSPMISWVLVAQAAQYENWKAEWDRLSANLRKVESDTDPEVAAKLRHALMAAMADSIQ